MLDIAYSDHYQLAAVTSFTNLPIAVLGDYWLWLHSSAHPQVLLQSCLAFSTVFNDHPTTGKATSGKLTMTSPDQNENFT